MSFVDTAMVGRLDSAAIGGVGIGSGLFFAMTVIGMGTVLGIDPLVAQAIGAGEHDRARRILWQRPTVRCCSARTAAIRPAAKSATGGCSNRRTCWTN